MSSNCWRVLKQNTVAALISNLENHFKVELMPEVNTRLEFLQDSRWGLWRKGLLLSLKNDSQLELEDSEGHILGNAETRRPRFCGDIPEGQLRSIIAPTVGWRALMNVLSLEHIQRPMVLRNEDEKIVCRMRIIKACPSGGGACDEYVTAVPLRGYVSEFRRVNDLCDQYLRAKDCQPTLAVLFAEQLSNNTELASRIPRKTDARFGIDAQMPAESAVRSMAHRMVNEAMTYRAGIREDIDTEFLHDYRIALRKARSIVTLLKTTLDAETSVELRYLMAKIVRPTNDLRDLDVFLLNESAYRSMLPDQFEVGLDHLFTLLQRERKRAYRSVVQFMGTQEYNESCQRLSAMLQAEPAFTTGPGRKAIVKVAKNRILSRYGKIRALGEAIDDQTPDDEVHELRIECKKLRYLMAFFTELFPGKQLKKLRKPLTQLQNILGRFNDYSVQKSFLVAHTATSNDQELVAAVSGLIAILHKQQLEERARVQVAFEAFGNQKIANEFEQLFTQ